MERQAKIDICNRVLHGTINSVVQYIDIAVPYVPEGYEDRVAELRKVRDEEVETANRMTDLVAEFGGVPQVGVFPYWNVDLNYLDVRFLARFAAQHQEKVIAAIDEDRNRAREDARLFQLLQEVLDEKRRHLAVLKEIGKPPPPPDPEKLKASQPTEAQHVPRAWSK
jgi:ferritin